MSQTARAGEPSFFFGRERDRDVALPDAEARATMLEPREWQEVASAAGGRTRVFRASQRKQLQRGLRAALRLRIETGTRDDAGRAVPIEVLVTFSGLPGMVAMSAPAFEWMVETVRLAVTASHREVDPGAVAGDLRELGSAIRNRSI